MVEIAAVLRLIDNRCPRSLQHLIGLFDHLWIRPQRVVTMRCQQFFSITAMQVNQEITDAKDLALNHRPNLIAEAGNWLLVLKDPV